MTPDLQKFSGQYVGERLVLAVAQYPFEAGNREFATLIPISRLSGQAFADLQDNFPTHGDVWWMLTPQTKPYAEPGRLVLATLEESHQPDKCFYQVVPDSMDPVREDRFVEILQVPLGVVKKPKDIIHPSFSLSLEHPPCATVYVRIGESLYGPLHATSDSQRVGIHNVSFKAARENGTVYELQVSDLPVPPSIKTTQVSQDTRPLHQGGVELECRYILVPSAKLEEVLLHSRSEVWKTPNEVIRAVTKRLFDQRLIFKRDKQAFLRGFDEIEKILLESPGLYTDVGEREVFELIRRNIDYVQHEAANLANAIVDSGLIDSKIEEALTRKVHEYVEKNSATVKSRIQEETAEVEKQLGEVQDRRDRLEQEIETERKKRSEEIDEEISRRQEQLREREKEIDSRRASLEEERRLITETLQGVTAKLHSGREETLQQFLALFPLLVEMGFAPRSTAESKTEGAIEKPVPTGHALPRLSHFVEKEVKQNSPVYNEIEFFERFTEHVEASGFGHRRIDLISFHLSFKCNDIVILGGHPGTGKSSMPRLYSEALNGEEGERGSRYLHVAVSPSWVDSRDLVGFVNSFERAFQPSESGIYMHLVNAQEEERNRGMQTGLWVTCLDEMNLAQVEHYFGSFLQALERPLGQRLVPCFASETVAENSPLYRWSSLNIPASVRFVGTVNFDETTRQLSQRLLDRANLLRIKPPRAALESSGVTQAKPRGPAINLASVNEWRKRGEKVPREIAEVLDNIEEPLKRLGCALNPRRQRALSAFIANAPRELCSPLQALDLQIAQRLLPRVRGLYRSGAQESFEQLGNMLQDRGDFPESMDVMKEISEESLPAAILPEE